MATVAAMEAVTAASIAITWADHGVPQQQPSLRRKAQALFVGAATAQSLTLTGACRP